MAIATPGDIVLDVVRAADPAAVEAARTRLASFAGRTPDVAFPATERSRPAPATPEAFAKFEAMVLQTFIQSMLPKDAETVYGQGVSGEMWQSLMAEKLGEAVAARGGIGIADRILKDHYVSGEKKIPLQGVDNSPEKAERASQEMLSVAMVQEIQRKVAQSLSEADAVASAADSKR